MTILRAYTHARRDRQTDRQTETETERENVFMANPETSAHSVANGLSCGNSCLTGGLAVSLINSSRCK